MADLTHGAVGKREHNFTALLPLRANNYNPQELAKLAAAMKGEVDTVKDGPDPEENLLVPAGYTYFGQFIDHDLTFDSTSSLDPSSSSAPSNTRTPRFDLDCVYGDGPDAQPFMYDGAKLIFKDVKNDDAHNGQFDPAGRDLMRNSLGRAIIGDKRNDENSIVSQVQLSFIKYHNAVVDALIATPEPTWNTPGSLFESARNEVRWTYQRLVVEDFLPRIVQAEVFANLQHKNPAQRARNYAFYTEDLRGNLPREFVAAAYRFGHSGIRTGYRMNSGIENRFSIFPASNDPKPNAGALSLLGFDPVTNNQVIDDWQRFFPYELPLAAVAEDRSAAALDEPKGGVRLQFAYKLDTTLVDPIGALPVKQIAGDDTTARATAMIAPTPLPPTAPNPPTAEFPTRPSLALLNLLRGDIYGIQGGQAFAMVLKNKGFPCKVLTDHQLATRTKIDKGGKTFFKFKQIDADMRHDTPLWFYVLAEAQAPLVDHFGADEFDEVALLNDIGAKTQLGWVGGRIVAEVFFGLLDSDADSFVNAAPPGWKPMFADDTAPVIFLSLLRFADSTNA